MLSIPPKEHVTIDLPDGRQITIHNYESTYQRLGFDAPRDIQIIRSNAKNKEQK